MVQHYRALPGMPGEHFDYGEDMVGTLIERLNTQVRDALDAGVTADKIVIDPGLGFSLTNDQCWQILRELPRFAQVGYPVLVGASRKRFVKALEATWTRTARTSPPTARQLARGPCGSTT